MWRIGGGKKKKKERSPAAFMCSRDTWALDMCILITLSELVFSLLGPSCVTAAVTLTTVRPLASQGAHLRIFFKKCCAWGRKVEVWENKINIVRFLHQALNVKKNKPRDIFFPHQKEYCLPFKPGSIFRVKVVGEQWEQLCLKAAEVSVSILRTRRRKCSAVCCVCVRECVCVSPFFVSLSLSPHY